MVRVQSRKAPLARPNAKSSSLNQMDHIRARFAWKLATARDFFSEKFTYRKPVLYKLLHMKYMTTGNVRYHRQY